MVSVDDYYKNTSNLVNEYKLYMDDLDNFGKRLDDLKKKLEDYEKEEIDKLQKKLEKEEERERERQKKLEDKERKKEIFLENLQELNILVKYKIYSKKDWQKWLLKNHPDKGGDSVICQLVNVEARKMGW